jgi:hypothetical protein
MKTCIKKSRFSLWMIPAASLTLFVRSAIGQTDPLDAWTPVSGTPNELWNGVVYANDLWVAVGGRIVTSRDGVNWVQRQSGTSLAAVAFGNGQFVAVGLSGTILTSADAVNWVQRQSGTHVDLASIAYGNGRFVANGSSVTNGDWLAVTGTSPDGAEWTEWHSVLTSGAGSGSPNLISRVVYGNGQFVAVGQVGSVTPQGYPVVTPIILTSGDGLTWVQPTLGLSATNAALNDIAFGNGEFVAVGGTCRSEYRDSCYDVSRIILTSTDGVNWTERFESGTGVQPEPPFEIVAYGNGQYVALGLNLPLTSRDGMNWVQHEALTQLSPGVIAYLNGLSPGVIAYFNGHFLVAGSGGTTFQSGNIIRLAVATNPSTDLLSLSLEGAVGLVYSIQSSSDLISWRTVTNFTSTQPSTIIFGALPAFSQRTFYRAFSQ